MLSATEYGMKNCFLMLNQVVKDSIKGKNDGIAFYSIEQLPKDTKLRRDIYNIVLKNKKKIILSLEDMVLENKKDINNLENLIKIKFLLNYSPKTFDI